MDGRPLLGKLIEMFEAQDFATTIGVNNIHYGLGRFMPAGNEYPQVTIELDEGESEQVFPAGLYSLYVTCWFDKDETSVRKKMGELNKAINRLINREGDALSEIDISADEGLRVANCLKVSGNTGFDTNVGKHYSETEYKVVMSEDETFDPAYAGDVAWV